MEQKLSSVAKSIAPSSIRELSNLARRCNAVNLAEGFPDFPAPPRIKDAAVSAINSDFNQYRHVQGMCDYVASKVKEMQGMDVDPLTDVVICCGQSEAFAATMFALIDQGDEVIVFDPSFGTYDTCIRLAGGIPVYVGLDPPYWTLNSDKLEKSFTDKTKALVLNRGRRWLRRSNACRAGLTFHFKINDKLNYRGTCKSFAVESLVLRSLKSQHILYVYEHITFDNERHISLASLPDMQRRTVITSSLSKTFSITGWRVGWAIAPTCIASAVHNIHVRVTDSAPAPFQEAALTALSSPPSYFDLLRKDYESKRDCVFNLLAKVGFKMQFKPQGSFFVFAQLPENCPLSDVEFVEELIKQAGVVAVPGRGFFHGNPSTEHASKRYVRFAFCKSEDTLASAAAKISALVDATGHLKIF